MGTCFILDPISLMSMEKAASVLSSGGVLPLPREDLSCR